MRGYNTVQTNNRRTCIMFYGFIITVPPVTSHNRILLAYNQYVFSILICKNKALIVSLRVRSDAMKYSQGLTSSNVRLLLK